jgi:hypothetical protein
MPSNRLYPEAICCNQDCESSFFPHDSRQFYCTEQCRINYHNDRRKIEKLNRYIIEKPLRENDKLLQAIYFSGHYKNDQIFEEFLINAGINFQIGTFEENLLTKRPIRWYHSFGLELIDKKLRIYTIHLRTKYLK